jgi:hypothetical protein
MRLRVPILEWTDAAAAWADSGKTTQANRRRAGACSLAERVAGVASGARPEEQR